MPSSGVFPGAVSVSRDDAQSRRIPRKATRRMNRLRPAIPGIATGSRRKSLYYKGIFRKPGNIRINDHILLTKHFDRWFDIGWPKKRFTAYGYSTMSLGPTKLLILLVIPMLMM